MLSIILIFLRAKSTKYISKVKLLKKNLYNIRQLNDDVTTACFVSGKRKREEREKLAQLSSGKLRQQKNKTRRQPITLKRLNEANSKENKNLPQTEIYMIYF